MLRVNHVNLGIVKMVVVAKFGLEIMEREFDLVPQAVAMLARDFISSR